MWGDAAATCPTCGAAVEVGKRFCGDCGTGGRDCDRDRHRHDSVLVAVGSGHRATDVLGVVLRSRRVHRRCRRLDDPEEVRELLTRYFEMARTVIGRYGGVIEKFIGDAVMAVWGTPVATEEDAERAVRAGLDLVDAVHQLGAEVGADGLAARAGVVTGEVAVTIGATNEGMVAGDAVNTAARIQAVAAPGAVLVDGTDASVDDRARSAFERRGRAPPQGQGRAGAAVAGDARRVGDRRRPTRRWPGGTADRRVASRRG